MNATSGTGRAIRKDARAALPMPLSQEQCYSRAGTSSLDVFVGRRRELQYLQGAASRLKAGKGELIIVSGRPGVGKSALIRQFTETTNVESSRFSVFELKSEGERSIQCRVQKRHIVSDMVHLHDTIDADSAVVSWVKSCSSMEIKHCDESSTGKGAFQQLEDDLINFRPIVIVIDNFTDGDGLVRSFISTSTGELTKHPILIVIGLTLAPETQQLADSIRNLKHVELNLTPLNGSDIREFTHRALSRRLHDEDGIVDQIQSLSGGEPPFVKSLIAELALGGDGAEDFGQLIGSLESGRIAPALKALCHTRILRLSSSARLVLNAASVWGARFSVADLDSATLNLPSVSTAFQEASEWGLLRTTDGDSATDYTFANQLLRLYLYNSIEPQMRREFHLRIAKSLQTRADELDAPVWLIIAKHFKRGGGIDNLGSALDCEIRAAVGLLANGDRVAAEALLAEGLEISKRCLNWRSRHAHILELMGDISSIRALESAVRFYEQSVLSYEQCGEKAKAARVHARLGVLLSIAHSSMDGRIAAVHQKQAGLLLEQTPNCHVAGILTIGKVLHSQNQFACSTMDEASSALEMAEQSQNTEMWCQAAAVKAYSSWSKGSLRDGFALIAVARSKAAALGSTAASFAVALAGGFMSLLLWDPRSAQRSFDIGLTSIRQDQESSLKDILRAQLGFANLAAGQLRDAEEDSAASTNGFLIAQLAFYKGDWMDARSSLLEECDRARTIGNQRVEWGLLFWLARLNKAEFKFALAEECLLSALRLGEERIPLPNDICTRAELALLLVQLGRSQEALSELTYCDSHAADSEDWLGLKGMIFRAHAALLAKNGNWTEATDRFEQAREIFQRYRLPWEEAENELTWGQLLLLAGDSRAAEGKWTAARGLYLKYGYGKKWIDNIGPIRNLASQIQTRASGSGGKLTPSQLEAQKVSGHNSVKYASTGIQQHDRAEPDDIYDLVFTKDLALLATLTHDAIAHIVSCADRIGKLHGPIDRIASAMETGVKKMKIPRGVSKVRKAS